MTKNEGTKKIYALLVGIDEYPLEVPSLNAAVKDIRRVEDFLRQHFVELQPEIKLLLDEKASYAAVIETFREHLGQAGTGDLALFYYCGHGSQQRTADEFLTRGKEEFDETLVLYDSRTEGGYDLADKEMTVLFQEVSKQGAQLVCLLDSCHGGGVFRKAHLPAPSSSYHQRRTTAARDQRKLSTYLDGYYLRDIPTGRVRLIPPSRSVVISASLPHQSAFELKSGGLFTTSLLTELEKKQRYRPSYADLFLQTRSRVLQRNFPQNPSLEAGPDFNIHQAFLWGNQAAESQPNEVYHEDDSWRIDLGAIHGIPTDRKLVFPVNHKIKGRISAVGPEKSRVELSPQPDNKRLKYRVRPAVEDLDCIDIIFEGHGSTLSLLKEQMHEEKVCNVRFVEPGKKAAFIIREKQGCLDILEANDQTLIIGIDPTPGIAVSGQRELSTQLLSGIHFSNRDVEDSGRTELSESGIRGESRGFSPAGGDWRRAFAKSQCCAAAASAEGKRLGKAAPANAGWKPEQKTAQGHAHLSGQELWHTRRRYSSTTSKWAIFDLIRMA